MLDTGRRRRRGPENQNGRISKNVSDIVLFVADSSPESGHAEGVLIIKENKDRELHEKLEFIRFPGSSGFSLSQDI